MAEAVEGGETITIVALAAVRECFSGPLQTRIRCTTVPSKEESERETGGLLTPSMHVMATQAAFFSLDFCFVLGFLESRASLSTWTSASSSLWCLFVFVLLLLSTVFILLLSLLSVVRREALLFQRTFPVCGAACGHTEAGGKEGQRGRPGKRVEIKRLESAKVN